MGMESTDIIIHNLTTITALTITSLIIILITIRDQGLTIHILGMAIIMITEMILITIMITINFKKVGTKKKGLSQDARNFGS